MYNVLSIRLAIDISRDLEKLIEMHIDYILFLESFHRQTDFYRMSEMKGLKKQINDR